MRMYYTVDVKDFLNGSMEDTGELVQDGFEFLFPVERQLPPQHGTVFDDTVAVDAGEAMITFEVDKIYERIRETWVNVLLVLKPSLTEPTGVTLLNYLRTFWFHGDEKKQVLSWARGETDVFPRKSHDKRKIM